MLLKYKQKNSLIVIMLNMQNMQNTSTEILPIHQKLQCKFDNYGNHVNFLNTIIYGANGSGKYFMTCYAIAKFLKISINSLWNVKQLSLLYEKDELYYIYISYYLI